MEFIHHQVALVEKQLAFVTTDPVDWKTYVQAFSWGVCLFESYLLYAVLIFEHMSFILMDMFSDCVSTLCN